MKRSIVCAAFSLWAACGEDVQHNSLVDTGELCVSGEGVDRLQNLDGVFTKIEPGQPLSIGVQLDGCLSASCDTERSASCHVELDRDRIVVTSRLAWKSRGGDCTADCGLLQAHCDSPPLEAGQYRVHLGKTAAQSITVPGNVPSRCVEVGPSR